MTLEYKVVMIGAVAVGKTALANRLQYGQFEEEYEATVGAGYISHRMTCDGKEVEIQLWDTAGMERYRSLGPIYYRDALAAIIVYDQTDQSSADAIEKWLSAFKETVKTPTHIAIVASKDDLPNKVVPVENMQNWAHEQGFDFYITSAKTGGGVSELFTGVVRGIMKMQNIDADSSPKPELTQKKDQSQSCC